MVKNLTHLDLSFVALHEPLIYITIATSPFLSNLVSLNLSKCGLNSEAVAILAASTTLANITHLNLSQNELDDELITQLFSPPSLLAKKLQSLDLGIKNMTISSLQVLFNTSPHLTELLLGGNRNLGPNGVASIATHMKGLTKLDLECCYCRDAGYASLAASSVLTNLRELNLTGNYAGVESIIALVNSPIMANLTRLDLCNTQSGPKLFAAIATSTYLSQLQHLELDTNQAGDEGIIALARSTTLTNLTRLGLGDNNVGPDGINALCTSPMVSKLTCLCFSHSVEIGPSIVAALAAPSSTLFNLIELNLTSVGLIDEDVLQLLATPNLDQLNVLKIRSSIRGRLEISKSTKAKHMARFYGDLVE